jgi:manganese/zinc/iron transport system permease protein
MPTLHDILSTVLLQSYNTRIVVLGTAMLGLASGITGAFLLLRKRSLMGDALSHATFPGIGIAFAIMVSAGGSGKDLLGLLTGATISGVLGVLCMLAIRNTTRLRDDVAMGFALSVFFGTGAAVYAMVQTKPGAAGLESFIYGKAASMVFSDVVMITVVGILVTGTALLLLKEFTVLCFDEAFAASTGWPVLRLDILLLVLVTAVTVTGLQAVGLILIIAFLIIPPTAARFWTNSLRRMLVLSGAIGAISGWLGASVSALFANLPAGALIVLTAAAIFLFSMLFGSARGVVLKLLDQAKLQRRIGRQHLLRAAYEILETMEQPVSNQPIPRQRLLEHRSWSNAELSRLLAQARQEDHIEPVSNASLIHLSESGFGEASRITRNHRLWELYLITHADIAPSHVDRDADLVEHILGSEMVRALEAELKPRPVIPSSPHRIPSRSSS